jgi:hypothetical protein
MEWKEERDVGFLSNRYLSIMIAFLRPAYLMNEPMLLMNHLTTPLWHLRTPIKHSPQPMTLDVPSLA